MAITIRARRRLVNKLLSRRQILLDVFHQGKANVSQKQLKQLISQKFKSDTKHIVLFGFKNAFGGSRSTGFALLYDNLQYLLKYEPHYRLRRSQILPKRNPKRKTEKQLKKKIKKSRAGEKRKVLAQRKVETKSDVRKAKQEYLRKIVG